MQGLVEGKRSNHVGYSGRYDKFGATDEIGTRCLVSVTAVNLRLWLDDVYQFTVILIPDASCFCPKS